MKGGCPLKDRKKRMPQKNPDKGRSLFYFVFQVIELQENKKNKYGNVKRKKLILITFLIYLVRKKYIQDDILLQKNEYEIFFIMIEKKIRNFLRTN